MYHGSKYIKSRRCDEPMRRSKEQCDTPGRKPWRCTGDCKNCICSIYKTNNGTEHHNNFLGKQIEDETL